MEFLNSSSDEFECSICLNKDLNKEIFNLECKHKFHLDCINKWWQTGNVFCPLCKKIDNIQKEKKVQKDFEYLQIRRIAIQSRVFGPILSFQVLVPVTYCSTPNIETQLPSCPETTLEPSTIVRGRYVEGRQFIRTIVTVPENRREVYCFLPIYFNNTTTMEIVRNSDKKCLCF